MCQKIKDRIGKSMGMKFVATLSVWVMVLMMAGTFIVARMMIASQERSLEGRGREVGAVLAKAALDRLASSDILGLNLLVGDSSRRRPSLTASRPSFPWVKGMEGMEGATGPAARG